MEETFSLKILIGLLRVVVVVEWIVRSGLLAGSLLELRAKPAHATPLLGPTTQSGPLANTRRAI